MKQQQQQRSDTIGPSQSYGKDLSRLYRGGYEELICRFVCFSIYLLYLLQYRVCGMWFEVG